MPGNNFLLWLKRKKDQLKRHDLFDRKLVKSTQKLALPSWPQLKYLNTFLNSAERRLIGISLGIIIISSVGLLSIYLSNHITNVPKSGGEYSEAMIGQPKYINPLFAGTSDIDADISSLIYTGLFHYNKENKLEPELATSFVISEDKKTYDISLRNDVRWSDGKPFTINDVLYTFELIQNPEVGSPLVTAFQGVKIEKKDNNTVRFILKDPFAPFLSSLTVGIIPEHIWADIPVNSIKLAKDNLQPVGTGAWQFSKLLKGPTGKIESYLLARNELYFKDKPYLSSISFKFFDNYQAALEAIRSQNINAISFVPNTIHNKLANRNLTLRPLQLPQYTSLFFNQNESLLKSYQLRLALSQAIDKKQLVSDALNNLGEVINSPFLTGGFAYDPSLTTTTYNVDKANQLLDKSWTRIEPEQYFKLRHDALIKNFESERETLKKASTTAEIIAEREKKNEEEIGQIVRQEMDSAQNFYRRDKEGNILSLTIATVDTPEYSKTADLIKKMWEKIGVRTEIKQVNSHQITREYLRNRNYQILLYGEILGYDPDPYPFWHSSQSEYPGLNLALYSNRTADKLLEDARVTLDEQKRADLYVKFQKILDEDLPAVFLYSPTHIFAVNKNIMGITVKYINSPSDRFNDISHWFTKTKWKWR